MDYIFNLLNHYGIWLGFVLVAIENIGIPFPIEFVYLYCQNLISIGATNLLDMMLFLTSAHMVGAVIAYYIGFAGNSLVAKHFKENKALIKAKSKIELWYSKYGSFTNFITRLVGYVRPWSSLVAGFGKENIYLFLLFTFLGTVIFNIVVLLFSGVILYLWQSNPIFKYLISAGFIFFFAGIWFLFPWLSKKFKI